MHETGNGKRSIAYQWQALARRASGMRREPLLARSRARLQGALGLGGARKRMHVSRKRARSLACPSYRNDKIAKHSYLAT